MEICGHLIKESEIVGIGPLMVELPGDIVIRQLYNRRRQYFLVHLKTASIKIESDWIDLGTGEALDDQQKKDRETFSGWKNIYAEARGRVENLINQPSVS